MSTVQEIEAVIPKLSRAEIEEIRAWIDDFLEDFPSVTRDQVAAVIDLAGDQLAEAFDAHFAWLTQTIKW